MAMGMMHMDMLRIRHTLMVLMQDIANIPNRLRELLTPLLLLVAIQAWSKRRSHMIQ